MICYLRFLDLPELDELFLLEEDDDPEDFEDEPLLFETERTDLLDPEEGL